jgi:hypothetical protein
MKQLSNYRLFFRNLLFFRIESFILIYFALLNLPIIIYIFTCYFEVNLLASELNYFLFDIKTILQALACF